MAYDVPPPEKRPEPGYYYHFKHDPNGPLNDYAYYIYGIGHHTEDDCRPEDAFMQVYRLRHLSKIPASVTERIMLIHMLNLGKVIQHGLQDFLQLSACLTAIVSVFNDDYLGVITAAFVSVTEIQSVDLERDRDFPKQFG